MLIKCVLVKEGPGFIKHRFLMIRFLWDARWGSLVIHPTLPPLLRNPTETLACISVILTVASQSARLCLMPKEEQRPMWMEGRVWSHKTLPLHLQELLE